MSQGRIPTTLAAFNEYFSNVTNYLQTTSGATTNGGRLGLTVGEVTAIVAMFALWYTGNPAAPGAWEKHNNPLTKGKATRLAVDTIMLNFNVLFQPFLVRMSGSANITTDDRLVLNIAPPSHHHRIPVTPISDGMFVGLLAPGGGNIEVVCRTTSDASRPSLPKDCDGVELAWSIATQPPTADDAQNKRVFSKSKFAINVGLANAGKTIYVFARWINTKHPEINGKWSAMYSIMIA